MVDKINEVRRADGVPPLRYSPSLSRSSARYARYLARGNRFQHAPRIRASSRFSGLGEILARSSAGQIDRVGTIVSWLGSPSHRDVLLSPSFRFIGAGRAWSRLEQGGALVWTVQFGG